MTQYPLYGSINYRGKKKPEINKDLAEQGKEETMNAGSITKKWHKYLMDSSVLDRAGMAELRMTKDVQGYNSAMYVIIVFSVNGGIEETLSENTYSKEEIFRLWKEYKNL